MMANFSTLNTHGLDLLHHDELRNRYDKSMPMILYLISMTAFLNV